MSEESTVTVTPVSVGGSAHAQVETVDVSARSSMGRSAEPAAVEVVEAPKPQPTPAPKEKISPKIAQLREREAQALAREQAAEARIAEAEAKAAEAQETRALLDSLKKNPSKVLSQLGISFNDLATALLEEEDSGDSTPSEIDTVKAELEAIKAALADKDLKAQQSAEAAEAAQLEQAVTGIKEVIANHLEANADDFDLIRSLGKQDSVYDVMYESFKQTGEVMHFSEACQLIEGYLTDNIKSLSTSKKLQQMMAPPAPPKPQKTSFGRTLSNQVGQVAAAPAKRDVSKLSHEERIAHAKQLLRFN